jgi:crotonobetaine/carnitine-CoA ligase
MRTVATRDDDVLFTTLPLFHINAQQLSTMGSILADLPFVLRPRFSASSFWSEVRESGATIFNYIGAMLAILLKAPESPGDAANPARLTFGGGASKEIWHQFEERFGVQVVEGFGLTETATVCMTNPLADRRPGTIGKPVSWADARIVDEQDEPAPPDTPGEIVVRSWEANVMMRGYFRMRQQTATAMRGGWFHTGDRGRMDSEGYFYFMDRLKDCIRRRGENISSFEVERAVNKHPAVLESAAVGVPSELGEEDVKIVVVLREGLDLAPEELVRHCEGELARFMVPRYIEFRSTLPKTPTERVQKFALRAEGAGSAWDREAAGRTPQGVGS